LSAPNVIRGCGANHFRWNFEPQAPKEGNSLSKLADSLKNQKHSENYAITKVLNSDQGAVLPLGIKRKSV